MHAFLVEDLERALAGRGPDEPLFPAPVGGPLRLSNWRRRVFEPAAASCGIAGLTPHGLRHTAASLAISAGATPLAVQRMLGHASAKETLDTYSDLFEDDLDALSERMSAARRTTDGPSTVTPLRPTGGKGT